jgi:hypothetical protein
MRNRLLLLAFWVISGNAFAQFSEGGLPPSFRAEWQAQLAGQMPSPAALPALDFASALQEDSKTPGLNRFAAPVPIDVNLSNTGVWRTLPNGDRVWLCALRSPSAKGLSFIFEAFQLPAGAQFYAYASPQQVLGAYTAQSCLPSGKFMVGVLKGETAYLELYEPAAVAGQSVVSTKRADVVYDVNALNGAEDFGQSLACHVNVNCPAGAGWQSEKKGVARILMTFGAGQGWCSGSLIANTSGSYEPYFLTAYHCQLLLDDPDFGLWRFDFDYESANCSNPAIEPTPRSVLGCERVSFRAETDFMLLKLNPIPGNYDVYFNGWNRNNNQSTLPANTTYIHHPNGDIKKISIDTQAVTIHPNSLNWGGIYGISPPNSHWKSLTDIGTFQQGSSGSPLFDSNKRISGQLHGGSVHQFNPCLVTGAYFGRFNLSWDQGSAPQSRLKEWLDPGNTGTVTQNGYARPLAPGHVVSGTVKTHWGSPIGGVKIELSGGTNGVVFTDTSGNFRFDYVPKGGSYTLRASLDSSHLNGVTTFDLVLVSKHILGTEPFDSPWKIIAADVNKTNSITTFDIVEARKVILGVSPKFTALNSWRFWPSYVIFNNASNPFMGGLPIETIPINNLQADFTNANFIGVKIGDVNNTAQGN